MLLGLMISFMNGDLRGGFPGPSLLKLGPGVYDLLGPLPHDELRLGRGFGLGLGFDLGLGPGLLTAHVALFLAAPGNGQNDGQAENGTKMDAETQVGRS